jgi:hypothetical protein
MMAGQTHEEEDRSVDETQETSAEGIVNGQLYSIIDFLYGNQSPRFNSFRGRQRADLVYPR